MLPLIITFFAEWIYYVCFFIGGFIVGEFDNMFLTLLYFSYCVCVAVGEEDEIERPEQGYESEDFMLQVSDNMLDAKNLVFTVQGEEFLSFAASIKRAEHSIAPTAGERFEFDEMILGYQNDYLSLYYNSRLDIIYEYTFNLFCGGLIYNKFVVTDHDIAMFFFDNGFNSLQLGDKKESEPHNEMLGLQNMKFVFDLSQKNVNKINLFNSCYVMENYIQKGFYTHNIADFVLFQRYDFFDSYTIAVSTNKVLSQGEIDSDEAEYFHLKLRLFGGIFLKYDDILGELYYEESYDDEFFNILFEKNFVYKDRKYRIYSYSNNLSYINSSYINLPFMDLCRMKFCKEIKKGI